MMALKPYFAKQPIEMSPAADPTAPATVSFARKPPHFHCPNCWGEEFRLNANDDAFCVRCNPAPVMLVCIPEICGSS